MSTTLYIAYPDIPVKVAKITTSHVYSDFRPIQNLFRGERYHHGKLDAATASDRVITFTLPTGKAQSCNYFIIARADLLIAQGVTNFKLQRSSDGSSWTDVWSGGLYSNALIGERSQDFMATFTETSAYQYWRAVISGISAATRFSKLYFGKLFDIGTYPDNFFVDRPRPNNQEFYADSGAVHRIQTALSKYKFNIEWDGVSDAKINELFSIIRPHHKGLFLYAPEQIQILNNNVLMHVKAVSIKKDDTEGYPDWNKITIDFEELIG